MPQNKATARRMSFLMNTWVGGRVSSGDRHTAEELLDRAFESLKQSEALLSRFIGSSEISRLNRFGGRLDGRNAEVAALLKLSDGITEKTDGAFDVRTAALTDLWRQAQTEQKLPSREEIGSALRDRRIDLGAIGKGHALDRAIGLLARCGVEEAVLDAGGTIACLDPGGLHVGVRHPLDETRTVASLVLKNEAVSTSANDQRALTIGGRRFGHLLDPRSGRPVEGDVLSVSVAAGSAAVADALSTALFVLGPPKGIETAKALGATKIVIVRKKWNGLRVEEYDGSL